MITLQKLSGKELVINAELIESIEATPDTIITLVTGNRYVVKQSPEVVVDLVVKFKQSIMRQKDYVSPDWQNLKKT